MRPPGSSATTPHLPLICAILPMSQLNQEQLNLPTAWQATTRGAFVVQDRLADQSSRLLGLQDLQRRGVDLGVECGVGLRAGQYRVIHLR